MKLLYSYWEREAWRHKLTYGAFVEFDIAKRKLCREMARSWPWKQILNLLK